MRHAVAWCLMLALVIHGYSGLLIGMLGSMHRHAEVTASVATPSAFATLISAVRHWHEEAEAQRGAIFVHAHPHEPHDHHHGLFERHHHDAEDASVDTLGAKSPSDAEVGDVQASSAPAGAASPTLLCASLAVPTPAGGRLPWPAGAAATWRSADLKRHDRPPQA